ncbi:hypothetical protein EES41_23180 [Streptomyces sp. ADI95-16]|nr:hypothetical protein EES41_23180 [Streptomyces sp. ADI95-16]
MARYHGRDVPDTEPIDDLEEELKSHDWQIVRIREMNQILVTGGAWAYRMLLRYDNDEGRFAARILAHGEYTPRDAEFVAYTSNARHFVKRLTE